MPTATRSIPCRSLPAQVTRLSSCVGYGKPATRANGTPNARTVSRLATREDLAPEGPRIGVIGQLGESRWMCGSVEWIDGLVDW
jgi:hypothetical protein